MKRAIITLALGMLIGSSVPAFAAIGDTVEAVFGKYNIIVDGKPVVMEADPLVYQGNIYVKLREAANLMHYDATYKADTRTAEFTRNDESISITSQVKEGATVTELVTMTPEDEKTIQTSENQIALARSRISENTNRIASLEEEKAPIQKQIDETTDSQRLMFLNADLQSVQIKIDVANEQIKMDQEAIISMQAYIDKIKAKY